jgi:hypothetical protein
LYLYLAFGSNKITCNRGGLRVAKVGKRVALRRRRRRNNNKRFSDTNSDKNSW